MNKYRKKPVVIEAVRYMGNKDEFTEQMKDVEGEWFFMFDGTEEKVAIDTLEGVMVADVGDYIIRGVKGELYPCKPDIFEMTYEMLED